MVPQLDYINVSTNQALTKNIHSFDRLWGYGYWNAKFHTGVPDLKTSPKSKSADCRQGCGVMCAEAKPGRDVRAVGVFSMRRGLYGLVLLVIAAGSVMAKQHPVPLDPK